MARLPWTAWAALAVLAGIAAWGFGTVERPEETVTAPARSPGLEPTEAVSPDEVGRLVRALDDPTPRWRALWRLGELGPAAFPAVRRLVELLREPEPLTRRLAAEALGRIGPAAGEAEGALRAAWDASEDKDFDFAIERAMARIGGWTCFPHEVPEAVTFLGHPFLRVVEEAHRRTWLKGEDAEVAARAWHRTQEHARRLATDRLYRLGDQTLARTTAAVGTKRFAFESRWSAPFLICASKGDPRAPLGPESSSAASERGAPPLSELAQEHDRFSGLLGGAMQIAHGVYRRMLTEHGEALGLDPLEDEYGGRPELRLGIRSFADGFPVVLWIWVGDAAWSAFEAANGMRGPRVLWWAPGDGEQPTHVTTLDDSGRRGGLEPERTACAVVSSLVQAFGRQANRWASFDASPTPLIAALCAYHARFAVNPQGSGSDPGLFVADVREVAAQFQRAERRMPWIPLRELLAMKHASEAMEWADRNRLPVHLAGLVWYRGQAWGLAKLLGTSNDPLRRDAWVQALKAVLERASPLEAVEKVLHLRDADDWEPLEREYAALMDALAVPQGSKTPQPAHAER